MTIQTGYAIIDLAALKALTPSQRTDGYARLVKSVFAWYAYIAASTAIADNDAVVMPNDNPNTGRWIKSSGVGGGENFSGAIICTSGCTLGGKGFNFYAPQSSLKVKLVPGFDISITSGTNSIQLHRWNQEPNTGLTGRQFVAEVPHAGGEANVEIDSTHRWISVFARNPSNDNFFDGVCFTVSGNVITLLGFN